KTRPRSLVLLAAPGRTMALLLLSCFYSIAANSDSHGQFFSLRQSGTSLLSVFGFPRYARKTEHTNGKHPAAAGAFSQPRGPPRTLKRKRYATIRPGSLRAVVRDSGDSGGKPARISPENELAAAPGNQYAQPAA